MAGNRLDLSRVSRSTGTPVPAVLNGGKQMSGIVPGRVHCPSGPAAAGSCRSARGSGGPGCNSRLRHRFGGVPMNRRFATGGWSGVGAVAAVLVSAGSARGMLRRSASGGEPDRPRRRSRTADTGGRRRRRRGDGHHFADAADCSTDGAPSRSPPYSAERPGTADAATGGRPRRLRAERSRRRPATIG